MFELLFKVTWHELLGAQLRFAWPMPVLLLVLLSAVFVALWCGGYFAARREFMLMALRAGLAIVAVLIAARPQLLLPRPDSASGTVVVLVDDSASMTIEDMPGGISRTQAVKAALSAKSGTLARALEARFAVRYMRFDARLHDDLVDAGGVGRADVSGAEARRTMAGARTGSSAVSNPMGAMIDAIADEDIAALVLVGDGGQVSGVDERELLARLRASGIAVHVLGVGDPRLAPDVSVQAVSLPARVLNGDEVAVGVELSAVGLAGQSLTLTVSDNGVLAGEQSIVLDATHFRGAVEIPIRVNEPGLRRIEVRVQVPSADRVAANNSFSISLKVRSEPVRILHFEAQPRFEVKFLRRALSGDAALSLSSLVRTGDNRFLRLGIDSQVDLAGGFPATAKELFAYHVLVIGSVKVATFTAQQLQLLEDFVSVRGGSVLFLGGRDAFAEGGWGASSISRMLPVSLDPVRDPFNVAARAMVTPAGREHVVTKGLFEGSTGELALTLPALAMVNPVRRVKRGASVLLFGDDGSAVPLVMLAWQRFGAGRVVALPVSDTWRWRMHADVPPEDRRHELFWRRLLRWLARDVPSRSSVRVLPAVAAPGQSVRLEASIRDEHWRAINDSSSAIQITTPLGDIVERSVDTRHSEGKGHDARYGSADGLFTSRYLARETGLYEVQVTGIHSPPQAGSILRDRDDAAALMVSAAGEEFIAPALQEERLRRIADASAGSYRRLDQSDDLVERIAGSVPMVQSWHRVGLWNAPILLVVMLMLACSEWWLRRQRRNLP